MIAPIILIPFIAYIYNDWYLLFGILFSYVSTFLATKKHNWQWAAPLLFMFYYWFKFGFHIGDHVNFFWLCLLWGNWMYLLAVGYEEEFAKIAILKDPDLFNKLSQQGTIYFLSKSITSYENQINWEFYYFKARAALIKNENLNMVIEYLNKAIELKPNYAKLYWNRGLANTELENFINAVNDFDISIQLSPNDGVGYYGKAFANFKLGNIDSAKIDYAKANDLGIYKLDQVLTQVGSL